MMTCKNPLRFVLPIPLQMVYDPDRKRKPDSFPQNAFGLNFQSLVYVKDRMMVHFHEFPHHRYHMRSHDPVHKEMNAVMSR